MMMRRSRDQDQAFGQMMLTLRAAIGLTQANLAEALHISRRSIMDWEAGNKYPSPEHLKLFIAITVEHQAFHSGREEAEIRALWKAAHSKVLIEESWLADLLSHVQVPSNTSAIEAVPNLAAPAARRRRVDWGDALAVPAFYGREW